MHVWIVAVAGHVHAGHDNAGSENAGYDNSGYEQGLTDVKRQGHCADALLEGTLGHYALLVLCNRVSAADG